MARGEVMSSIGYGLVTTMGGQSSATDGLPVTSEVEHEGSFKPSSAGVPQLPYPQSHFTKGM